MSEAKHTPGPWTVEDCTGDGLHDICLGYTVQDRGNPILLATCFFDQDFIGPISLEECNANARLIAAAPKLLEACKAFDEAAGRAFITEANNPLLYSALTLARAAIAEGT